MRGRRREAPRTPLLSPTPDPTLTPISALRISTPESRTAQNVLARRIRLRGKGGSRTVPGCSHLET